MANCFRTLISFLILGISSMASAQLYVTDDNFADSVQVHQIEICSDGTTEILGVTVFNIPMGEIVRLERLLKTGKMT